MAGDDIDADLELVELGEAAHQNRPSSKDGSKIAVVPPLQSKNNKDGVPGDASTNKAPACATSSGAAEAGSGKPPEKPPEYKYVFEGVPQYWRSKLYVHLANSTPWSVFLTLVVVLITVINLVFALILFAGGGCCTNAADDFSTQFYFAYQTFSTVGYGGLHPDGKFGNITAYIITLTSYVTQTLVTGLILAKFFKPKQALRFSERIYVHCRDTDEGPYNHLVLRVNNDLGTNRPILHAVVQLFVFMYVEVDGMRFRRTFNLKPVTKEWPEFYTPWTVMHRIDDDSPLRGLDEAALAKASATFTVVLTGLDTAFSNTISAVRTYNTLPGPYSDLRWGKKPADVIDVDGTTLTLRTKDWNKEVEAECLQTRKT